MATTRNFPRPLFYAVFFLIVFFQSLLGGMSFFQDDLLMQFGIFWKFLASQIGAGHFPLWNPYLACGQPFFADPNSMASYPFLYPALLFPIPYGLGVFFFFHLLFAALGTHFLLRVLNFSGEACRLGAVTFCLCGFAWWEIIHPPIFAAFCWFPWFFAFIEKFIQKARPLWIFAAGLCFAFLFLAGSVQMSLAAFYGGLLYFTARWLTGNRNFGEHQKGWFSFLVLFLWGAFPLVFSLIPFLGTLALSNRYHAPFDYEGFASTFSMEPSGLYQFMFPGDAAKSPLATLQNAGFLGVGIPFFLYGAWKSKRREAAAFAAVGFFGFFLALGKSFPFHLWACEFLPGFSQLRAPYRFICLYSLAGAFFTALGYEIIQKRWRTSPPSAAWIGLAFLFALPVVLFKSTPSLWIALCLLTALTAFFWKSPTGKAASVWPKPLFLFSVLLSLLLNVWANSPAGPASNFDFAGRLDGLPILQQETADGRLFISDHLPFEIKGKGISYPAKFPVNAACVLGLHGASSYSQLWPRSFADIHSFSLGTFSRLMAVRGFLLGPAETLEGDFIRRDLGKYQFYKSRESLPWVWAPDQLTVVENPSDGLTAMGRKEFNPYRLAYLAEQPAGLDSPSAGEKGMTWKKTERGPNESLFQIHLDQKALVVFSELADPGWRAFIDGDRVRIYTADHVLRSLVVPAGNHEVRFQYRPWWAFPLVLLGFLWLGSVGFWFYQKRGNFN